MATLKTRIVLRNDLAENWLLNDPTLLAGEVGVETDTGLFKIGNGSSSWKNLSYANEFQATNGDEHSIHLDTEEGILTLVNWNEKYFRWNNETKAYEEAAGWKTGLEPKVGPDGKLAWFEPNPSTLEGVESSIAALQTTTQFHTEEIAALREEAATHLKTTGGTLTGVLVLADGSAAASEQVVDTKIAGAIQSAGHLKRVIVEVLPSVAEADLDTIYMIKGGANKDGDFYSEWMVVNGIFEKIGDTNVDLSNYLQKVEGSTLGNLAALGTDGVLTDAGIAAQAIKDHLNNEEIHITSAERTTWNSAASLANENAKAIAAILPAMETKKYEIFSAPIGASVRYSDNEIRVMVPADYVWEKQQVGATGNANMYYMGFRAYAPANAVTFKESEQGVITDEVLDFTGDFAGIDAYGRKYSIVWLPLASYDPNTDTWTYFGESSSTERYVGWTYCVEWYDENDILISSDSIRINLSNESCHLEVKPYYMGKVVESVKVNGTLMDVINNTVEINTTNLIKGSDEVVVAEDGSLSLGAIPMSKLYVEEEEEVILGGGGSDF